MKLRSFVNGTFLIVGGVVAGLLINWLPLPEWLTYLLITVWAICVVGLLISSVKGSTYYDGMVGIADMGWLFLLGLFCPIIIGIALLSPD
ncbi:hypothetical protein A2886_00790 [candidate division WWE3 bacterium RIFCSPHIGHO2_01_FULL_42_13]|uniref:Uncharacterized protein n=1 Tax=candidate division WWE3 bacterium RIFCSPHIGHO2_01_FULL_42_13 TaxID=1802617 RepID=A0A1F4UQB8_UNCKA|nr:MAG: hypothetical protein A2886_00790 [candidate division WWE3 bacterium RIFCSPHIGHO2_01_FULL_42_13]